MKLTKKLISLLLSMLIISSCFIVGTVVSNAARGEGIPYSIDSVTDKLIIVTTLNNDYPSQTEITYNTFTVTYYLTAPEMIVDGQGFVTYDNTKLRLVSMEFPKITDMLWKNESVSANTARFSFSKLDAFDFTKGGEFVVLTFDVIDEAKGTASVDLTIEELDSTDTIYFKSCKAKDDSVLSSLVTPSVTNGNASSQPISSDNTNPTTDNSTPTVSNAPASTETNPTTQTGSETQTPSSSFEQPSSGSNTSSSSEWPSRTNPTESDFTTPTESQTPSTDPIESDSTQPTESQIPSTDPIESDSTPPTESQIPSTDPIESDSTPPTESQIPNTDPIPTTHTTPQPSTQPSTVNNFGKGADGKLVEKTLTNTKSDKDPNGSTFNLLQVRNTKTTKNSIKLSYKKPSGTKKFVIYGVQCGSKYKKIKETNKTLYNATKLKKGKYYKFIVVALNSKGKVLATSKTIHVATKGGKYGNPSKVKITNTSKVKKITKGKKVKIKTKVINPKNVTVKAHRKVNFESTKPSIVKVSKTGTITAKKKGTATIYAYAQNGIMTKVKIKVK